MPATNTKHGFKKKKKGKKRIEGVQNTVHKACRIVVNLGTATGLGKPWDIPI